MANLRVNKIAAVGVSTETTGSVFFDGTDDYLVVSNSGDDLTLGTGDFTIEFFVYLTSLATSGSIFIDWRDTAQGVYPVIWQNASGLYYFTDGSNRITTNPIPYNVWTHVAVSRSGTSTKLFHDGAQQGTYTDNNNYLAPPGGVFIGSINPAFFNGYEFLGYMSNIRVCKGHAVYTENFTVPTRELEVHPETVLLCCHDGENIFADKSGRNIIAAYGDRLSSPTPTATDSPIGITTFNPGLTRNVDATAGPTFQGGAGFVSQNWLTLPKGTTTDRNRTGGRGLFAGGVSPNSSNTIYFINISSSGIAGDFGDLTVKRKQLGGCASSTRGVFAGGSSTGESPAPPFNRSNVIDYVTLASTGNAADFGDLTDNHDLIFCGLSNNTRGIWGGGETPSSGENVIQYVTIATLGDAQDFGDLTRDTKESSACASPTRGIFFTNGGYVINYITIATLGNAQDFGDYNINSLAAGCSDSTRGIVGGGAPGINTIQYITISTLGNAQDFGDLTHARKELAAVSNSIRGIFGGGHDKGNTIDYVTIQTTGNAVDWGDLPSANDPHEQTGCSDSHGGLS